MTKKAKKRVRSRRPGAGKGQAFERQICKALSLWVSGNERDDLFWRSAMSGGRATIGKRAGINRAAHAGDIVATDPLGHLLTDTWYIECKNYKALDYRAALLTGKGRFANFWRVADREAAEHGKLPMLIMHENISPILVAVRAPFQRAPGDGQYLAFSAASAVARMHLLGCDLYTFEGITAKPFERRDAPVQAFLKPGELERILSRRVVHKSPARPGARGRA